MEELQIETLQEILKNGGNVIKTRDDRELISFDKDGKVLNTKDCGWLPDTEDSVANNNIFRSRIEPWLTSVVWVWDNKCHQYLSRSRLWYYNGWGYIY